MSDWRMMGLALDVARRAAGRTSPNPMVGVVIVRDGAVLAEGWTQPPGQHHAEPHALEQLGGRADGATMYVVLEPCCHWGRTPPCTDAIIKSGVRKVVIGTVDPFPLVSGRGIQALQDAGIEVVVGVREHECKRLNRGFLKAVRCGLPEVTLKAGMSLDGRIASEDGQSRWITGPAARARAHGLRDTHDAVMVGIGTVLADDCALDTRLPGGRNAVPVILDTWLRTPPTARVLSAGRRPLLLCGEDAPASDLPADIVRLPRGPAGIDLEAALRAVVSCGHHHLLVEGGGTVHRSLLGAGLVDRIELFVNGRVLAGGPGFASGPGFSLTDAPAFRFVSSEPVGDDLHLALERAEL
ncbi:MAG: bifunctional diaminohydroxyphosphoribosylaminopyrimidine deaminase/5-amino-6-(5-phosphoribosylamino)uracil reductase RibD [Pseudomonadota bacterium]|nr:bifunctional diaminohydroxyphosphoribosylaminopyrimidine deaminase/5-amino-6-(5-phosphoribosylamino)uracil reductase RibD [Pseudomonadota bacterium]